MNFNNTTKNYLREMQATFVSSKYKVFQVDFKAMKAFVNKQDTYRKRNGKMCHVEHHFGRWIEFKKEDIGFGIRDYTTYDSSVHGLEEVKGQRETKYLKPEAKVRIIEEYFKTLKTKP